MNSDSTKRAFVWLKKDSTLSLHPIKTGMDDETEVEVIAGLDSTDVVVTGYTQQKKSSAAAKPETSPFMPKRPGNSNSRSKQPARPPQ